MAKKKHRIHPQGTRYIREAVPSPREVAAFVAPRTMEDGLSLANILGDAGEMTPFAGAVPYAERELGLRDYTDDDILLSAIMGFPILGKFKNVKEALGRSGWNSFKRNVQNGKRKLYSTTELLNSQQARLNPDEIISSRSRVGANRNAVEAPLAQTVIGPGRGGTNLGMRSEGQQMVNTNTRSANTTTGSRLMNGANGYTGDDMYSPLRQPVDPNTHGPWRTDLSKADKPLQDVVAKNEDRWQFYIDDALGKRSTPERAEDMALAAIGMGRPDIADKIRTGQKSGRSRLSYKPYHTFASIKATNFGGDMPKYMDHANRQTEKAIREQFAMIPDELKQEFTQRYGTWDLLQDWEQNPTKWNDYKKDVAKLRRDRASITRAIDRRLGRNIER